MLTTLTLFYTATLVKQDLYDLVGSDVYNAPEERRRRLHRGRGRRGSEGREAERLHCQEQRR